MANAPIFGTDGAGRIVEWNNKAAEVTGVPKAEALGRDLVADFLAPDARATAAADRARMLLGSGAADLEFPLVAKDGRRVELLVNAAVRRDVDGIVVRVICVGRDVTDMRRLMIQEAELLRLQAANEAKSQVRRRLGDCVCSLLQAVYPLQGVSVVPYLQCK
jgi:PAS domain S-box-containing protein